MAKGSVKRRGKVWSLVVDLGPDPATGARRQARRSGFATKKEAESALRDLASSAAAGTAVARRRVSVTEFLAEWLETIRPRVRETTWVSYEMAVNRITRQIGAVQLQALTPLQVEGLYATLLEKGGADGRAVAPKTVRNCHIVLRRALADAERLGLVTRNPAASAKPVAVPRAEQRTWSSEEIQRFFDAVAGERLSMAFVMLATTGMRRGEVLGPRWEDVDLAAGTVTVAQQLVQIDGVPTITKPKTKKSKRTIAIGPRTVEALRQHRARQAAEQLSAESWVDTGLVFTKPDGQRIRPDRIYVTLRRLVEQADVPWIGVHGLRHTMASLALQNGTDIATVSQRLGHSDASVTTMYLHGSEKPGREWSSSSPERYGIMS